MRFLQDAMSELKQSSGTDFHPKTQAFEKRLRQLHAQFNHDERARTVVNWLPELTTLHVARDKDFFINGEGHYYTKILQIGHVKGQGYLYASPGEKGQVICESQHRNGASKFSSKFWTNEDLNTPVKFFPPFGEHQYIRDGFVTPMRLRAHALVQFYIMMYAVGKDLRKSGIKFPLTQDLLMALDCLLPAVRKAEMDRMKGQMWLNEPFKLTELETNLTSNSKQEGPSTPVPVTSRRLLSLETDSGTPFDYGDNAVGYHQSEAFDGAQDDTSEVADAGRILMDMSQSSPLAAAPEYFNQDDPEDSLFVPEGSVSSSVNVEEAILEGSDSSEEHEPQDTKDQSVTFATKQLLEQHVGYDLIPLLPGLDRVHFSLPHNNRYIPRRLKIGTYGGPLYVYFKPTARRSIASNMHLIVGNDEGAQDDLPVEKLGYGEFWRLCKYPEGFLHAPFDQIWDQKELIAAAKYYFILAAEAESSGSEIFPMNDAFEKDLRSFCKHFQNRKSRDKSEPFVPDRRFTRLLIQSTRRTPEARKVSNDSEYSIGRGDTEEQNSHDAPIGSPELDALSNAPDIEENSNPEVHLGRQEEIPATCEGLVLENLPLVAEALEDAATPLRHEIPNVFETPEKPPHGQVPIDPEELEELEQAQPVAVVDNLAEDQLPLRQQALKARLTELMDRKKVTSARIAKKERKAAKQEFHGRELMEEVRDRMEQARHYREKVKKERKKEAAVDAEIRAKRDELAAGDSSQDVEMADM
ncbi:hypothetical protein CC86DRAFT_375379 [Ophiobolus disseminans]|uniref:Uncharacterized protein n=1 Tax=Ophiobolus disseminans TaxID=1469910 RepID=A0A6A6ZDP8_9PLEO|nr:hypothetical protein CC86DRAFT_375379 [Ophiobolus disseminans]